MRQLTLGLAAMLVVATAQADTPQASKTLGGRPPTLGSPSNNALGVRKAEAKGGLFGNGLVPFWRTSSASTNKTGFRPWFGNKTRSTAATGAQKPLLQRMFGSR